MQLVQYATSFLCLYLLAAVILFMTEKPQETTPANIILSGTLFATWLISFGIARNKMWLQVTAERN
jgi:hypothetical protein